MNSPNAQKYNLILKGGVSSGLIYPEFIAQIRKELEIGGFAGSSAGAIASALGACAELAWRDGDEKSYERYAKSISDLTKNLTSLFDPSLPFRALFKAILLIAPGSGRAKYFQAIMCFAPTILIGAFIALLISWITKSGLIISILLIALGAFFALTIHMVSLLVMASKKYNFGICKGLKLSEWISDAICEISAKDSIIRFKDFEDAGIGFRLAISNLNNGSGMVLPNENLTLKFDKHEFAKLFPQNTMQYLEKIQKEPQSAMWDLPMGSEMPILVALRISASCPALFEQIPFHTDKQKIYLSDGGICMNFPFDIFQNDVNQSIVIDLQTIHQEYEGERVWDIKEEATTHLVKINGLFSYVWELVKTMREGHAKHQIYALGDNFHCFRIGLKPHEGGMNLSNHYAVLDEVIEIGRSAGAIVAAKMKARRNENC